MNTKFEISRFNPCEDALEFRSQYADFKSAWENCPRGDWMLWLAQKSGVNLQLLTLAKATCAYTVIHYMNDERSKNAIDVALKFGEGIATIEELNVAAVSAADAADAYAAADASKKDNQLQTANICRELLTDEIYKLLNIK